MDSVLEPTAQEGSRLNLGCGRDIRPGWVNLDSVALEGVDVVHDLQDLPLPFADGRFEEIACQDILEHVDLVAVLRELNRVLAPGGRLRVRAPHFTSWTYFADPTHRTAFSIETLSFFCAWSDRAYYFDFAFSERAQARITFAKSIAKPWNWLVEPLINLHPRLLRYYEGSFLSALFPALNVEVTLVR